MSRDPLRLVLAPDPMLKTPCRPVRRCGRSIDGIANEMLRLMRQHDGIGLAANQAGIGLRIIVADVDTWTGLVIVNPVIAMESDEREWGTESCLSEPGIVCAVERALKVWVKGQTTAGKPLRIAAEGLLARVLQHEIDHLNGILLSERGEPIDDETLRRLQEGDEAE